MQLLHYFSKSDNKSNHHHVNGFRNHKYIYVLFKELTDSIYSKKKLIFMNLKKRFEHIELPAKLLDYFLRSNKSNINLFISLPLIID